MLSGRVHYWHTWAAQSCERCAKALALSCTSSLSSHNGCLQWNQTVYSLNYYCYNLWLFLLSFMTCLRTVEVSSGVLPMPRASPANPSAQCQTQHSRVFPVPLTLLVKLCCSLLLCFHTDITEQKYLLTDFVSHHPFGSLGGRAHRQGSKGFGWCSSYGHLWVRLQKRTRPLRVGERDDYCCVSMSEYNTFSCYQTPVM